MWGRNLEGQCGQGYASAKARAKAGFVGQLMAPRFVHALTNTPVARVACGGRFTLAVSTAGAVRACDRASIAARGCLTPVLHRVTALGLGRRHLRSAGNWASHKA